MKHFQNERGPALWRQPLDGMPQHPGSFIRERLPFRRLAQ